MRDIANLENLLDEAILDHEELEEHLKAKEKYRKIDEIPVDFVRRRLMRGLPLKTVAEQVHDWHV